MSCLRCLKQHSVILESLQYFACKYWKITKISSFWISTEFSCFQDLKFILILFPLFLLLMEAGIFLDSEQQWASGFFEILLL